MAHGIRILETLVLRPRRKHSVACGYSEVEKLCDHPGQVFLDRDPFNFPESMKSRGITNVMVFCTKGDLYRYRVKDLLEKYAADGLDVHNYPHADMVDPEVANLMKIFDQLELNLNAGRKTLMQ
jgi:cyclin-dependent kinase inhibitor 3